MTGSVRQLVACGWPIEPDSGRIFVIDELYKAKQTQEMLAEEIHKRDLLYAGRMITGICDTSAFANVGLGQSRAAVMDQLGGGWRPATKGPGSRVQGIQSIYRLLRGSARDGGPALMFFSRCERLIEILPTLPRSRYDPEDIDSNAEDHCSDALAYGLQYVGGSTFREVSISFGDHPGLHKAI